MRRTPEATALSPTILNRPISPVRAHMRAAAQLDRISVLGLGARLALAHADDADLVAVFLAEQRHRALGDRLVGASSDASRPAEFCRIMALTRSSTARDLRWRHRPRMGEIEAQPLGRDQRALLRHVRPKHLAQRLVQQMGGRVVGARRGAARMIDLEVDRLADLQRAASTAPTWRNRPCSFFCVSSTAKRAPDGARDQPAVADLAAGLAVERRLVDDDDAALAGLEL